MRPVLVSIVWIVRIEGGGERPTFQYPMFIHMDGGGTGRLRMAWSRL